MHQRLVEVQHKTLPPRQLGRDGWKKPDDGRLGSSRSGGASSTKSRNLPSRGIFLLLSLLHLLILERRRRRQISSSSGASLGNNRGLLLLLLQLRLILLALLLSDILALGSRNRHRDARVVHLDVLVPLLLDRGPVCDRVVLGSLQANGGRGFDLHVWTCSTSCCDSRCSHPRCCSYGRPAYYGRRHETGRMLRADVRVEVWRPRDRISRDQGLPALLERADLRVLVRRGDVTGRGQRFVERDFPLLVVESGLLLAVAADDDGQTGCVCGAAAGVLLLLLLLRGFLVDRLARVLRAGPHRATILILTLLALLSRLRRLLGARGLLSSGLGLRRLGLLIMLAVGILGVVIAGAAEERQEPAFPLRRRLVGSGLRRLVHP